LGAGFRRGLERERRALRVTLAGLRRGIPWFDQVVYHGA
jgi:hypothetical protein